MAVWLRLTAHLRATKQAFAHDPNSAGATDQGVPCDPGEKDKHKKETSTYFEHGVVTYVLTQMSFHFCFWFFFAIAWLHIDLMFFFKLVRTNK